MYVQNIICDNSSEYDEDKQCASVQFDSLFELTRNYAYVVKEEIITMDNIEEIVVEER